MAAPLAAAPPPLAWVACSGAPGQPQARSGHSFTTLAGGDTHVLFGGTGLGAGGKAAYLNDAHVCRVGADGAVTWAPVQAQGPQPAPRARHTAVPLDSRRLLVWGGLDSKQRFHDCWVLDVTAKQWTAVEAQGEAPPARAHHTATKVSDKVIVFGGYGGSGTAFGDVWVLHLGDAAGSSPAAFRWEEIKMGLPAPAPRFDHSCCAIPTAANSQQPDNLVLLGGRDSSQHFTDGWLLDLSTWTWQTGGGVPVMGGQVCNHFCSSIDSVPFHKVFAGFGSSATLKYSSAIQVLDAGTKQWSTLQAAGDAPCGREDTAWAFDARTTSLVLFGGWSSRWLGDTWRLDVSSIVGPGYACLGISPGIGPVAGGTEVTISGLRFRDGKVRVRLTSPRGETIVDGTYISSEAVRFTTPPHEQHGPLPCEVAVAIGGSSWTVTPLRFQYFANMLPSACLAYGPGVLPQVHCGLEMPFLLVARDTAGSKRTSGGDAFEVSLESKAGQVVGSARVVDRGTGVYECFYRAPATGHYKLHVRGRQLGGDGGMAPIRGSPFAIGATDPWAQQALAGAAPARRAGATLTSLGSSLVLYGGDKSLAAICHAPAAEAAEGQAWEWHQTGEADRPTARKGHAAAQVAADRLVVCGGTSLEGEPADLADVRLLHGSGTSWAWEAAAALQPQLHQRPDGGLVPTERAGHSATVLGGRTLVVFGGEHQGQLLQELCLLDLASQAPRWAEPAVEGELPCARRGASAAASGEFVVIFGGCAANEQGEVVPLNDLYLLEVAGPTLVRCGRQEAAGALPPPRSGALLQEHSDGRLLLYGGSDAAGKPLGDAWLLDVASLTWECLYDAAPEAASLPAPIATLHAGRLVCLAPATAGGSRLDAARSIDLLAARESVSFLPRMRPEVAAATKELEAWVAHQQHGVDLATAGGEMNTEKLLKVMDALYQCKSRRRATDMQFDQLREACATLQVEHRVKEAARIEKQLEELRGRWEALKRAVPHARESIKAAQEAERARLKADIERFGAAVGQYVSGIYSKRGFFAWATGVEAALADIEKTTADLAAMRAEHSRLESLAKLFDCTSLLDATAAAIRTTADELAALDAVWRQAEAAQARIAAWNEQLFTAVDVPALEEGAKSLVKEVKTLPKEAREHDCFKGLDQLAKNYLASVPLVGDLRSPAMRDRHWDALREATKVSFTLDASFRLSDLLKLELHKYAEDVGEIVDRAQKEEKMEAALAKLRETWARVEFVFTPHTGGAGGKQVSTVKMSEDDFAALEDSQVVVQGLVANRYMNTFREPILDWNRKLNAVADVVQLMSEIQRSWLYLESLFIDSDEVRRELPEATQRFAGIDAAVRAVLLDFVVARNCVACCNREGLLKHLETQQAELELCEKALADYMESKRRAFPRFYFVSTADLLDILSNGSTPHRIMQHMSKCFQAIDKLRLDSEAPVEGRRPKALGMESCVGTEYVAFKTPLPLEGKVESYMAKVVDKMRSELRGILADSVRDYPTKARDKWMFDWPSQIILVVNQIFWTQEVEEAFEAMAAGDKGAMKAYNEKQVKQLTRLIEVTRTDLSKADRQKAMNMITIDAHSRDIVQQIAESGTADRDCFAWQAQLRTYWDRDIEDARVRISDAVFPYGHEYLGNGPRLVITPLTDRIYITSALAMWLSLGTAPAGPAGTGKTETTKDLASQLGKACYVFNCAPEMDYRTLGDMFKGLAASGSMGCLDEYNRLLPSVLSVNSVQLKAIFDAQRRKAALPGRGLEYVDSQGVKHPAVPFTFIAADGVEMPLEEGASVFITMNPGYIGRAELPESLKALFRPITVVVPDRQLIMENMLMAEGFITARELSKKFAALYYLLEDLLSPQKHYDWGLRAIKSVLVVAGGLLRSQEGQDEQDVLFRALRDFNLPKILAQDLDVFCGLLADIFPGVDPLRQRDPAFEAAIRQAAAELGLEADEEFVKNVVSLSELLAIRHCVFLMGPTGCGRSEVIRVLARAIAIGAPAPTNPYLQANNKKKVVVRDLNPKSISTQELYGYINMATREWKDGLLSCTLRELANVPDDAPKWIVLDGDLDANWIESMNSLMDDNRLLTLPSNERIRLLPHMKLIFEIRDLRYATPATATRAGILYISEGQQWRSMVESWLRREARTYAEKAKWPDASVPLGWLRQLFDTYVPPAVFEMRKSFQHLVPLGTMNFVATLCNILEGLLRPENLPAKCEQGLFELAFVFACVWAFGGALGEKDGVKYRQQFDKWWKGTFTTVRFPQKGTCFDYYPNFKQSKFAPWADLVQPVEYDGSVSISQMFVPTAETVSLRYFLDMMIALKKPIMLVGGAGVGKTQLVKGKLQSLPEELQALTLNLSYYTEVGTFQKTLESSLEKKTANNFGPPAGRQLLYVLDDLNAPKLDAYETSMCISLVRQLLGYGHWYDRQKLTLKNISGTQLVACMNPTAGSFNIDPRLQRLFATFAVETPSLDSLMTIFGCFLHGHLKKFNTEVQELGTKILQAALALHERVCATFRKTAVNHHYDFSVRQLQQVFQGLLQSTPERYNGDPTKLIRLWLHESDRTYSDRLVSAADLASYGKIITAVAKKHFNLPDIDDYYRAKDPKPLIFCHFASGHGGDNAYNEVTDWKRLQRTLGDALAEYNETNAVMDLVLFDDAIRHVCRVSRVISNPGGHALLVGVGGSGKQSLARLAAHLCGYALETIVISGTYSLSNFREDLARMCKRAGVKDEGVAFLLTESQVVDERMLVLLNDLLASGEVPDLFAAEEKDEIINACRAATKVAGLVDTNENVWRFFIQRVAKNLHLIFTCSPVGDGFRVRSQRFPATVNNTVLDWFHPWPEASLHSVAQKFLSDLEVDSEETRKAVVGFIPAAFASVGTMSKQFYAAERRHVYTTPKSFLEMTRLYKGLLAGKRATVTASIQRLEAGLAKLRKTQGDVDVLVEQARAIAVEVDAKLTKTNKFAEEVGVEKEKVNAENAAAQVEAEACAAIAKEVAELQAKCEAELAAAEPLVQQAEAALNTLTKKDLGELKALRNPPAGVDDITAVCLCLLENVPKDRSWAAASKLMSNVDAFLARLKGFKPLIDGGEVQAKAVDACRSYLALPHFNREAMVKKSAAAAGLCEWAINIVKYFDVWSTVEPKRQELAQANAKLAEANTKLQEVQAKVAALNAQLAELESQYAAAVAEKDAAVAQSEACQRKLDLANRLIAALASEGGRWASTVEQLKADYRVLTGDMLLAAAFVSYAGPFSARFRELLVKEWVKFLTSAGIPMSPGMTDPLKVLVDDAKVASWVREGLPADPTSVENGAILTNSERWPLLLDPNLTALQWIKEREGKRGGLVCSRLGAPDLLRVMERAIAEGHTLLLENMGETVDAVLMPVITRATYKKGRSLYLKLGDKEVEYNKDFRLVLHSKSSNPHLGPELQAETTLINFNVTEGGLEEALVALVVSRERADLEKAKAQLIVQNSEFVIRLKELEDGLLAKLSAAEGDLTEDSALIESLEESKALADEIAEKMIEAQETERQINTAREAYRGVAARGAMLFFLLQSLSKIHAFYSFSLNAFLDVFSRGIDAAPGGRRKPAPAAASGSGAQHHRRTSLADLSRRQTAQPVDLAATIELARRSTASGHRASHAGGEHEAVGHSHPCQSVLGEVAASGHSRRPSVFGDASLSVAQHRLSVLGPGRRPSMLGGSHRPSAMGGPRMSMLGHAAEHRASMLGGHGDHSHSSDHRTSMLGGQEHPAPVVELEEEEAPVELTPEQLEARLAALTETCTYCVFSFARRGLFDRDKLVFTTLLATQTMLRSGAIDGRELEHLLRWPRAAAPPPMSDELQAWMGEAQWAALVPLAQLPTFAGLLKDVEKSAEDWQRWAEAEAPEAAPMPGQWAQLSPFQRILVLRALKPDRVPAALAALCEATLGAKYVNSEAFSAKALLAETSPSSPVFFVLFPGYSPSAQIEAYARTVGRTVENGKLSLISLGQGQEGPAERVLDKYIAEGGWVFLDNLHLMSDWAPKLERKLEEAAERAHKDFRCFVSAEPIAGAPHARIVPEGLLQSCIKVSNEPPSDIRSNMRAAWGAFSAEFFERPSTEAKRRALRSIIFGLCFFHSVLLGRKKYGTGIGSGSGSGLGYCRAYSFNQGDLLACGDIVAAAVDSKEHIPWTDLRYLLGSVFYGGHVVDEYDRRLLTAYLDALIHQGLTQEQQPAGDGQPPAALQLAPGVSLPPSTDYGSMASAIDSFPPDAPPLYSLHANAQLSLLNSQTDTLFATLLDLGGAGSSAAGEAGATVAGKAGGAAVASGDAAVRAVLIDLLGRLPAPFSLVDIESRVKTRTPFVVLALQEAERMNALLGEMRRSLEELTLGLDGALNMSPAMEALSAALAAGRVPSSWMACMSTRIQEVFTLPAWFADVLKRHEQLARWTAGDIRPPPSIWLPGLFNPKACLTAVLQQYARQQRLPLDALKFLVDVTTLQPEAVMEPPADGLYIHGLTLEAARWDAEAGCLADSLPGQLRQALPVLHIRPVTAEAHAEAVASGTLYLAPVYQNGQRANVYSPLIGTFPLRTAESPAKWTLRSAALLLQDETAAV